MNVDFHKLLVEKDGYYEIEISSFEDFIFLIRPDKQHIKKIMTDLRLSFNPIFMDYPSIGKIAITSAHLLDNTIIYRGHGDSDWHLAPTFYRRKHKFQGYFDNFRESQRDEYEILEMFQKSCDLAGVYLPSDCNNLRHNQQIRIDSVLGTEPQREVDWFTEDFFELAAFAQHYGIPTRLLDWTKNSLVACYFACSYALEQNYIKDKKISIWVLNSEEMSPDLQDVLKILDLPKGVNQHISHQQGVLTYSEMNISIYKKFGLEPTLQQILQYFNNSYRLLKINLSIDYITHLFRYCDAHNFNACHLFRGAYGAAQHTKDLINHNEFNFYES